MGCYSYLCNGCQKNLRAGEQVHLFHVRHGEVIGEAEGTYNMYGSVEEDYGFDNAVFDKWDGVDQSDPNGHDEVMVSSFDLDDSALRDCCYHDDAESGVVAYHKKCYHTATRKNNIDLTPSDSDPNQGMEPARKIYC